MVRGHTGVFFWRPLPTQLSLRFARLWRVRAEASAFSCACESLFAPRDAVTVFPASFLVEILEDLFQTFDVSECFL